MQEHLLEILLVILGELLTSARHLGVGLLLHLLLPVSEAGVGLVVALGIGGLDRKSVV